LGCSPTSAALCAPGWRESEKVDFNKIVASDPALDYIFPSLSLDDCARLGCACKCSRHAFSVFLGQKCPFAPCVMAIRDLARHLITCRDVAAPLQDYPPLEEPLPEYTYGWACEVFSQIAKQGHRPFLVEFMAHRTTGDLICSLLLVARSDIRRRLQTRVGLTEREIFCVLEFVVAWVHHYPYDSQTLYISRYVSCVIRDFIALLPFHDREGALRMREKLFSIIGVVLELSRTHLTEIQQQWFLYNLFFTVILGLGNRMVSWHFDLRDIAAILKEHTTPLVFGNFISLWHSYSSGSGDAWRFFTSEEGDTYNRLTNDQLQEFVEQLNVQEQVKAHILETKKIPLMDELCRAIAAELDVPEETKYYILKTRKIPLMSELFAKLGFPEAVKARVLRTGEIPLLDDRLVEIVERLDVPEEMKACLKRGKILSLDYQLMEIIERWNVPEKVKAHILTEGEIPYGWDDAPLEERVLVSVRQKSRDHLLFWEVLGLLHARVNVETLLLNATPEEALVQFSIAETRLHDKLPPRALDIHISLKKKFLLTILRNKAVFGLWRSYLKNPDLLLRYGGALRSIFHTLFKRFKLPQILEAISHGDDIVSAIDRWCIQEDANFFGVLSSQPDPLHCPMFPVSEEPSELF